MADERKCFAGDLGTDQLGKRVTIETATGAVVTDVLTDVWHSRRDGEAKTLVRFANVMPVESFTPFGNGFDVDPVTTATVLP